MGSEHWRAVLYGIRALEVGVGVQLCVCRVADEIASSGVPICYMAGWMDSTASASIHAFVKSPQGTSLLRVKRVLVPPPPRGNPTPLPEP